MPISTRAPFRTHSGRMVELSDISPNDIDLSDIAHHLARICRFGGSVRRFYSVAQHSVYCATHIESTDPRLRRAALLHDAAEAYTGDMVTGLKRLCPDFKRVQDQIESAVLARFGIAVGLDYRLVKEADLRARLSEARDLFDHYPRELLLGGEGDREPFEARCIDTLSPDDAEFEFLAKAYELGLE